MIAEWLILVVRELDRLERTALVGEEGEEAENFISLVEEVRPHSSALGFADL